MTFVRKAVVDKLFHDMVMYRGKAVEQNEYAKDIGDSYTDNFKTGRSRLTSQADADRATASDVRFSTAVGNNQMYDRFAMRDAAVLTALLKMVELGLLTIRDDNNNKHKTERNKEASA